MRRFIVRVGLLAVLFLVVLAVLPSITDAGRRGTPLPASTPTPAAGRTPATDVGPARLSPTQPKLVFTYFYYWYDLPSGPHSTALTDHPAEPDASYQNVGWFRKQLLDMEDAGIDGALAVYWGAGEPSSDTGLQNMADAAAQLRAEGHTPPRIGLFLDTGYVATWPEQQRDLRQPENRDRVYELIYQFYTELPRDQWALVDGKPVVWLWGASWLGIRFDQGFFDYLYAHFERDLGVRPYVVAENSWDYAVTSNPTTPDQSSPVRVDDYYSWGAALGGFRREHGNVSEIGPGYDERQLNGPGRTGRYRDRQNGSFYAAGWQAALSSGSRFVAIETWNEFHEASDIADSLEYGRQYIDLTRDYTRSFKAST
jgi:hypothetical protein